MESDRAIVERMYEALRQRDAAMIVRLLHPDFVARACPGLPLRAAESPTGPSRR
jgi:ketosteroid isomerase-like protein